VPEPLPRQTGRAVRAGLSAVAAGLARRADGGRGSLSGQIGGRLAGWLGLAVGLDAAGWLAWAA